MKRIINIALFVVAGLLLTFTSCKNIDFGDLNQPEHAVVKTNPANLLAGAATSYGAIAGRLYSTNYAFYIQWMTQGIYDDEQRYANFQGAWAAYYAGPLANIQEVINTLQDTSVTSDPAFTLMNGAPQNVLGEALILKAIVFKRITDIFGAIPMSQALDKNNITPAFDTQQQVYQQLVAMLREARDTLNAALPGPKGDIFYGGNVAKLKQLANSLLLEVGMQLSEVEPDTAKAIVEEALSNPAGLITNVADEAWYTFDQKAGVLNPWSRLRYSDYFTSLQFQASLLAYDTLDATGVNAHVTSNTVADNRILAFMDDPTVWGEDYMQLSKTGSGFGQPWSEMFTNPALPMPELTAAYTWLNIAEAAARGWNTNGITVDSALKAGIIASYASYDNYWNLCSKRGIDPNAWAAAANSYAQARAADLATVDPLQVIGEEKWVALYPIAWKAWAEWRRTHFPKIHPLPAAKTYNGGHIPTRYRYPAETINLNNEHYLQGVQDLHDPKADQNYAHVWWDPHND